MTALHMPQVVMVVSSWDLVGRWFKPFRPVLPLQVLLEVAGETMAQLPAAKARPVGGWG